MAYFNVRSWLKADITVVLREAIIPLFKVDFGNVGI